MLFQPSIPSKYSVLTDQELTDAIEQRKRTLGSRIVILGHHYQQDDVIRFADFSGDSLKLAKIGAEQDHVEFIIFCGVHFMAESADILTGDNVRVILPDLSAGCSMADMADLEQLEDAWDFLTDRCGASVIPITYVNSAASIKAFCGGHGGACCTSSNAQAILDWAFTQGDKVIFLPDQHLGRNTAYAMGIPLNEMVVFDPHQVDGGLTSQQVQDARVLLWKGHCSVHGLFSTAQCDDIRRTDPDMKILVHPECTWEVVEKSDLSGSTEFIIKTVADAAPGSQWAIGTEIHLVERLARRHPDQTIRSLAAMQCLCTTMYRINPKHLLWVLDELVAGRIVNQISVDPATKRLSTIALERMLAHVPNQPIVAK